MKLELKRIAYKQDYTIGHLMVDGKYFCDTLEDEQREVKVMHETCIPKGKYRVILNWSNRFQRIMPLLLNVPGFEGIRIHPGSNDDQTSGCLLVGKNKIKGRLIDSRETFDILFEMMQKSFKNKETITIEIS